jgi:hypothetical protein
MDAPVHSSSKQPTKKNQKGHAQGIAFVLRFGKFCAESIVP